MKRNILLPALALTLAGALTACSNTASTVEPSAPAVAPSESPAVESPNAVTRGFDRAMDDIGDAVSGVDNAARRSNVINRGTGDSASAPGWESPSTTW